MVLTNPHSSLYVSHAASVAWERYILRKQPDKLRRWAECSEPGVTGTTYFLLEKRAGASTCTSTAFRLNSLTRGAVGASTLSFCILFLSRERKSMYFSFLAKRKVSNGVRRSCELRNAFVNRAASPSSKTPAGGVLRLAVKSPIHNLIPGRV